MGSVRQRGGLQNSFPFATFPPTAAINGLKTYSTPTLVKRLMVWDSFGNLYKENPQGVLNLLFSRPQGANTLYQSTTLFGREYQAFLSNLGNAVDIPRQYDDTNWDRVSQIGPGAAPTAVQSATAGNIAVGNHQVSVAFITRQGYITFPAVPPTTWNQAGASKQVDLTNIPIGPPNIVARLLIFTPVIIAPAVTGTFYSLPNGNSQLTTNTLMLINDNITTVYTVDFTDAILITGFNATYLFTQRELGECSFAGGYNSRTVFLGERNKQQNVVNFTFDGGFGGGAINPTLGSQGPNNCSVGSDIAVTSGVAWSNPGNIAIAAQSATFAAGLNANKFSDYLRATGFGFIIPSAATILGITVTISKRQGGVQKQLYDRSVLIVKGGNAAGFDHSNGLIWPTALTPFVYGGSGDLWGTTWLPADINAANFGVQIQCTNTDVSAASPIVSAFVTITVNYSLPAVGGAVGPLGWTQTASYGGGSSAITAGLLGDWQDAFAITGDGATNVRGKITQPVNKDYFGAPIIAPATTYQVRVRLARNNILVQGAIHIDLQSTIGAFTTSGLIVQAAQLTTNFVEFIGVLTAAIAAPPSDLVIEVYADGTPTNGGIFIIDSIEIFPMNSPFNYSTAWLSHAFNPESFDNTTSQIQIRPNDGQQLHAAFPIRNNYYFGKDNYLCYVTDDGQNEPASWAVNEVSATIGIAGPNACDWTEEWAAFAHRTGAYLCWGSDPVKITQEIEEDASLTGKIVWNSINWAFDFNIWVRIDQTNRRILIGAPVNGAVVPNIVFVLDYKWLDSPQDIASSPMVTYSAFTGKILAHGRGRRWTYWNIAASSMCFAERTDGTAQPFFGNSAGNGNVWQQVPCNVQAYDQLVTGIGITSLIINAVYNSYFAPSGMEEQGLQLGGHQKLLGYIKWSARGTGNLFLSIVSGSRTTVLRTYALSLTPLSDSGRGVNIKSERFSFSISTNAVGSWFQLEKWIFCMKKAPTMLVTGTNT